MEDLAEDYQRAGFGLKTGFGTHPALILVDFVAAYFLEQSPLYGKDIYPGMKAALGSALRIRAVAHLVGIPVILTKVELTPADLETNLMFRKTRGSGLFEAGSPF